MPVMGVGGTEGTADEQNKRPTLLLNYQVQREQGGLVKLPLLLLETTPLSYYWSTETDRVAERSNVILFILCHRNGYQ